MYVKSTYLVNFARYVQWPEVAFDDAEAPVTICVLGRGAMWEGLQEVVQGKSSQGRAVRARSVPEVRKAGACHVLFVGSGAKDRFSPEDLESLAELPVLTVGEAEDFLGAGGGIRLILADNRITFEVNLDSTDRAGLTLSSRMLSVAREVFGRSESSEENAPAEEGDHAYNS